MMVIVAMLFAGNALMTSCTEDAGIVDKTTKPGTEEDYQGPPVLEIGEPNVINALKVEIPLTAKKLASIGYKVVAEGENAPANALMVFRSGSKVNGNTSMLTLTGNDGLDLGKNFTVYIAATISDTEYYNNGEILTAEFTTPNQYADADVYIKRTHSEGADIVVQFPEQVMQRGHRIKWGIASTAMINYYGDGPLPAKLHSNDYVYPASLISRDTTLNINHYNVFRRNEQGEVGYYIVGNNSCVEVPISDPRIETGEAAPVQYYLHAQPGEPLILMMSEVGYADCPYSAKLEGDAYNDHITNGECGYLHPTIDYNWGAGWYWYPYDYIAYQKEAGGDREEGELPMPGVGGGNNTPSVDFNKYWHEGAWYKRIEFRLPGPDNFASGSVDVKIEDLRSDGCKVTFTPTGDTFAYFATIVPQTSAVNAGWTDLLKFVNNDPSLLQWLTTSEIAPYLSIFPYEGVTEMKLEEVLYDIEAGMTYHIIVNAVPGKMVDGDLSIDVSKQAYQHITFKLPEYTIGEPELIVTAYEPYSPYKVKFNVKNANPNIPVKKVVYAANETREFTSYMRAYGYTYADIITSNDGYANLSTAEIAEVNTDEGYDMEFDVAPNTFLTLAAMGWNEEGRPSDPDKEGAKAVAEARSTDVEEAEPLDMEKLNALKGDWTATATVKTYDYNTGKTSSAQRSWKVTIGDLTTNNTLSADDYKVFEDAGVNKESADAYLAEFNEMSVKYNASVLGQNRVLCQGWDLSGTRETSTASPWDLFLMPDYNASLTDYLFNDFGPKWFLQTDADGNIFVPVNYNVVPNMMCWCNGLDHYFCSGNFEKGYANYINPNAPFDVQSVGIPVEISEDGKTVTLKAVEIKAEEGSEEVIPLYPTMVFDNQGQLAFYNPYVMSEVVLTKGWNGGATVAPAKASVAGNKAYGKKVVNNQHFTSPAKNHSRTTFAPAEKKVSNKNVTVVTKKVATKEEIRQGMDKLMSKYNLGIRK